MLQAKTYLFCAIRPEKTYLKYTFATLGFAKNASVVQLAPKKATSAKSPAEAKLMAQLEEALKQIESLKSAGGGGLMGTAAIGFCSMVMTLIGRDGVERKAEARAGEASSVVSV